MTKDNTEFYIEKPVYDLKKSNITRFVTELSQHDWSFLYHRNSDYEQICNLFHQKLNNVFIDTIPVDFVKCTPKDKPWVTTYVKSLINKRWTAYHARDFPKYNNLKIKVKQEIQKAKKSWVKKIKSKDLWKAVNTTLGKNSVDPLYYLYSFLNMQPANRGNYMRIAQIDRDRIIDAFRNNRDYITLAEQLGKRQAARNIVIRYVSTETTSIRAIQQRGGRTYY